jgi:hypothetical protein
MTRRRGSLLAAAVVLLLCVAMVALHFMQGTTGANLQTAHTHGNLGAQNLAKAALETALAKWLNELNCSTAYGPGGNAQTLGVLLRLPLPPTGQGVESPLGKDRPLNVSAPAVANGITYSKAALSQDGALPELVERVYGGFIQSWDAEVSCKIERAFQIGPGREYPDWKVAGVEAPWACHPEVGQFLAGAGFPDLQIAFPDEPLLELEIDIKVMGISIMKLKLTDLVDLALESFGVNTSTFSLRKFSLDYIAKKLFGSSYPFSLIIGSVPAVSSIAALWPAGTPLQGVSAEYSEDAGPLCEKYGTLRILAKAKIVFKNGQEMNRTIEARKPFKVADIEPTAPLYSLFIANHANRYIHFNNVGGQFYVNNFDLLQKLKLIGPPTESIFIRSAGVDPGTLEFPGQIRVNYQGPDDKTPIICNVSFLGTLHDCDTFGHTYFQGSFGSDLEMLALRALRGVELPLMFNAKLLMMKGLKEGIIHGTSEPFATMLGNNAWNIQYHSKNPINDLRLGSMANGRHVSQAWLQSYVGANPPRNMPNLDYSKMGKGYFKYAEDSRDAFNTIRSDSSGKLSSAMRTYWRDFRGKLLDGAFNFLPPLPPTKMSVNIIQLGIALAARLVALGISEANVSENHPLIKALETVDCFSEFELPYMGTHVGPFTLPTLGWESNKTHLFGAASLQPTMTRDIEGDVKKRSLKWRMVIVGMLAPHRLPLIPGCPFLIPPIPLPVWETKTEDTRYTYNIPLLRGPKSNDKPWDDKTPIFDPALAVNQVPNLYTPEQYLKKATHYYKTGQEFLADIPRRLIDVPGVGLVLPLDGVNYIAESLGSANAPFVPIDEHGQALADFRVMGKGMIVTGGNAFLGCNLLAINSPIDKTVFSLVVPRGGLAVVPPAGNEYLTIEGAVYTNRGLFIGDSCGLHIKGNWATNFFNKEKMLGHVTVDFVSTRVRSSFNSLHGKFGRFAPERFHVSLTPTWTSWSEKAGWDSGSNTP